VSQRASHHRALAETEHVQPGGINAVPLHGFRDEPPQRSEPLLERARIRHTDLGELVPVVAAIERERRTRTQHQKPPVEPPRKLQ